MQKEIQYKYKGQRADVGHLPVMRLLPNNQTKSIGPFVFLDHMLPTQLKPSPRGEGAHPHRGIATFTYLLEGTVEHYDSSGNHGIVGAGGIQWMKAGNGVVHEENVPQHFKNGVSMHGMQFWINLPSKNKAELPKYIPVQDADIPTIELAGDTGSVKILLGEFGGKTSVIDMYSDQFMYHIRLSSGAEFNIKVSAERQRGIFVPKGNINVNDEALTAGEMAALIENDGEISLKNTSDEIADIILFGGKAYEEPIISHGPFVMNSMEEINRSFIDYQSGRYGRIKYLD